MGLRVERRFRELPRVKCVATNWELAFEKAGPVRLAICTFEMDLFNEGQLATGLHGDRDAVRGGKRGKRRESSSDASKTPVSKILSERSTCRPVAGRTPTRSPPSRARTRGGCLGFGERTFWPIP